MTYETIVIGGGLRGSSTCRRPTTSSAKAPACLNYLLSRPEFDPDKLSVLGRSLGGGYALRSASTDARLTTCVSQRGFVYSEWENEPPHDRASYNHCCHNLGPVPRTWMADRRANQLR
jgi:dienelactone hydrolase